MKLVATHLPDAKNHNPADSLKDWEIDALCSWLLEVLSEDERNALTAYLPSVAAKLLDHPVNVYGEET
jgi:hypothetical protein